MAQTVPLRQGEAIEDLLVQGYRIIQKRDTYRFGHDSVYLSDFATVRKKDRVLDLGCGDGVLLLLLSAREPEIRGFGVEIRPDAADRAQRSVCLNHLEERIRIMNGDLREHCFPAGEFDLAVSNPPYWPAGAFSDADGARTAEYCSPDALFSAADCGLRPRGRFAIIVPCARMDVFLYSGLRRRFSLKRLQMIHASPGRPGRAVLLEMQKQTNIGGCVVLPPIYSRDEVADCKKSE